MAFRILHTGDWHLIRVVYPVRLGDADGPVWFYPIPYAEPVLARGPPGARETTLLGRVIAGVPADEREAAP